MSEPKILSFDLETTANQGFYWGQNYETGIIETTEYWKILSYAAKWLWGKIIVRGWLDTRGEASLVKELWKLLDEADIVIAHNGKNFDIKKSNAKFAFYHLGPPSPYKVIDTKDEAKKYLSLPSYKLNDIADYFGIGHKLEHEGWPLWKKCIAGDKLAWAKMKRYNKKDVILLEKVYLELRPFIKTHPNLSTYSEIPNSCPRCGGRKLKWEGWYRNKTTRYHAASCKDCGSWCRDTKNIQYIKTTVAI